jgi:hypothetical protein
LCVDMLYHLYRINFYLYVTKCVIMYVIMFVNVCATVIMYVIWYYNMINDL